METLPHELIRACVSYLPLREILRSAQVSKLFKEQTLCLDALGVSSLDLSCYFDAVTDEVIRSLLDRFGPNFRVLKSIDLSHCVAITDQSLDYITTRFGDSLESLSLQNATLITSEGVSKLFQKMTKLKFLDLRKLLMDSQLPIDSVNPSLAESLTDFAWERGTSVFLGMANLLIQVLATFPHVSGPHSTLLRIECERSYSERRRLWSHLLAICPDKVSYKLEALADFAEAEYVAILDDILALDPENPVALLKKYTHNAPSDPDQSKEDQLVRASQSYTRNKVCKRFLKRPFLSALGQSVVDAILTEASAASRLGDFDQWLALMQEGIRVMSHQRLPKVDPGLGITFSDVMKGQYALALFSCHRNEEAYQILRPLGFKLRDSTSFSSFWGLSKHHVNGRNWLFVLYRLSQVMPQYKLDNPEWKALLLQMSAFGPDWGKVEQCYNELRCTTDVFQLRYVRQFWFQCVTCDLLGSNGICLSCAETDHRDHKVIFRSFETSCYCDCPNHEAAKAAAGRGPSPPSSYPHLGTMVLVNEDFVDNDVVDNDFE